ncbi:MAG: hypothetical protein J0H60_04760, partial [Rhizobiales bacterium]|nr:hypothetical protein [Hyphomicrobiales bacterium]
MQVTRRHFMGGVAGLATYGAFGGHVFAEAQKPSSPLTITIVDVAGNLALTQGAFDAYAAAKPDFVSRFAYTKAPSPELPAKLQAQQAGQAVLVQFHLVVDAHHGIQSIEQRAHPAWCQLLEGRCGYRDQRQACLGCERARLAEQRQRSVLHIVAKGIRQQAQLPLAHIGLGGQGQGQDQG